MVIHLDKELQHFHFQMPKLKPELQRVYLSRWIEAVAFSLISIFVPIFLLQNGFTIPDVILYYIVIYIPLLFFSPIAAKLIGWFGFKHTVIPHPVYAIIFFILLPQIPANPHWLLPLAFIKGMAASLYWMSINTLFIQHSTKGHRAREQGLNTAATIGISIVAPILGGIIILGLGFTALFYTAAAIMIFSLWPLFSTPDYKPRKKFKFKKMLALDNMKLNAGYFASGFRMAAGEVLFPILLYLVLREPLFVGGFKSLMAIIDLLIVLAASNLADKYDNRRIIKLITPVVSLLIFALYFANNILALSLLTISFALTAPFLSMSFIATYYEQAAKDPLTQSVTREIYLTTSRFIVLIPAYFLAQNYEIGFIIASIGTWFYLFV